MANEDSLFRDPEPTESLQEGPPKEEAGQRRVEDPEVEAATIDEFQNLPNEVVANIADFAEVADTGEASDSLLEEEAVSPARRSWIDELKSLRTPEGRRRTLSNDSVFNYVYDVTNGLLTQQDLEDDLKSLNEILQNNNNPVVIATINRKISSIEKALEQLGVPIGKSEEPDGSGERLETPVGQPIRQEEVRKISEARTIDNITDAIIETNTGDALGGGDVLRILKEQGIDINNTDRIRDVMRKVGLRMRFGEDRLKNLETEVLQLVENESKIAAAAEVPTETEEPVAVDVDAHKAVDGGPSEDVSAVVPSEVTSSTIDLHALIRKYDEMLEIDKDALITEINNLLSNPDVPDNIKNSLKRYYGKELGIDSSGEPRSIEIRDQIRKIDDALSNHQDGEAVALETINNLLGLEDVSDEDKLVLKEYYKNLLEKNTSDTNPIEDDEEEPVEGLSTEQWEQVKNDQLTTVKRQLDDLKEGSPTRNQLVDQIKQMAGDPRLTDEQKAELRQMFPQVFPEGGSPDTGEQQEGEQRTGIEDYIKKMEAELAVREFNRVATSWRREKFVESIKKIGKFGLALIAALALVYGISTGNNVVIGVAGGFLTVSGLTWGATLARNWWAGGDPVKEAKMKRDIANAKALNENYKKLEKDYWQELTPDQQTSIASVINAFGGKPGERFSNILQGAPEDVSLFRNPAPRVATAAA